MSSKRPDTTQVGLVRPIFWLKPAIHGNAEYEQPQLEQGRLCTDSGIHDLATAAPRPAGYLLGASLALRQVIQHV
jgi:hypothetical protein